MVDISGAELTVDSAHHISNGMSLMLRLLLLGVQRDVLLRHLSTLVAHLIRYVEWDVFEAALRRSATLLLIASRQLPELQHIYLSVESALNLETVDQELPLSADTLFASYLDMSDLSWLDSSVLLGALDGTSSEIL